MTERLRRARNESGFTLIELMVVVLVLGILMAIAIPTFLGSRNKAQNKAPQASLRIELEVAKLVYMDNTAVFGTANNATTTAALCTALNAAEPSVRCLPSSSVTPNLVAHGASTKDVSVYVSAADTLIMAARSASGQCLFLRTVEGTGVVSYANRAAGTTCSGYNGRTGLTWSTTGWAI